MPRPRDRKGEMRRSGERARIAQHEASHAVIARVLTLKSGRATIKQNYAEGHGHEACDQEKRGRYRRSLDAAIVYSQRKRAGFNDHQARESAVFIADCQI